MRKDRVPEMEEPDRLLDDYFKELMAKAARNLDGCTDREFQALLFYHYARQQGVTVARQVSGALSGLPCTGKVCPFSNGNGNGKPRGIVHTLVIKASPWAIPAAIATTVSTLVGWYVATH